MNAINPVVAQAAANGTNSTNTSALPTSKGLNDMFMQLLVAQLQNQSPLSPMDPTQFVGQLAQFSELSEITQINQLLQNTMSPPGKDAISRAASSASAQPPQSGSAKTASVPASMLSAAVSAAQAAIPNFNSPAASILNHQIQGVF